MNENNASVKSITLQNWTCTKNFPNSKQTHHSEILQVGDRAVAHTCEDASVGSIIQPLLGPPDLQELRGTEFLIAGDSTCRVSLQSDRWLGRFPREFVELEGGAQ